MRCASTCGACSTCTRSSAPSPSARCRAASAPLSLGVVCSLHCGRQYTQFRKLFLTPARCLLQPLLVIGWPAFARVPCFELSITPLSGNSLERCLRLAALGSDSRLSELFARRVGSSRSCDGGSTIGRRSSAAASTCSGAATRAQASRRRRVAAPHGSVTWPRQHHCARATSRAWWRGRLARLRACAVVAPRPVLLVFAWLRCAALKPPRVRARTTMVSRRRTSRGWIASSCAIAVMRGVAPA